MADGITTSNRPLVLLACMAAIFMAAIEGTIVATAMPTIVASVGGFSMFGWVFAAFLLPQAITVPIYGRLADLYGRKIVFLSGAGVFLVGSALCGFASTMLALVLFRAVQGLGAGAILPTAQTMIADAYPPMQRGRVQSYLSGVWAFAAIAGPVVGAFIVQHLHWALIFWLNLPLAAAAMALIGWYLKEQIRPVRHALDIKGAALMAVTSGSLMLALLQSRDLGWWVVPLVVISAVSLALLVRQERIAPEPMLPARLLRNRTIMIGTLGNASIGALMMGVTAFLPTYVQGVMGRDALTSGATMSLLVLAWPASGAIAARLIVRSSYRTVAGTGSVIVLLGALILLAAHPQDGLSTLVLATGCMGIGLGLTSLPLLLSTQTAAPWDMRGLATSSILFMRSIGQSLGTAVFGGILNLGIARRLPRIDDPVQVLMDPARRSGFSAADAADIANGVGASLHEVFIVIVIAAVLLLCSTWRLPHGTLSQAEQDDATNVDPTLAESPPVG